MQEVRLSLPHGACGSVLRCLRTTRFPFVICSYNMHVKSVTAIKLSRSYKIYSCIVSSELKQCFKSDAMQRQSQVAPRNYRYRRLDGQMDKLALRQHNTALCVLNQGDSLTDHRVHRRRVWTQLERRVGDSCDRPRWPGARERTWVWRRGVTTRWTTAHGWCSVLRLDPRTAGRPGSWPQYTANVYLSKLPKMWKRCKHCGIA